MLNTNDHSVQMVWFFLITLPIAIFFIDILFPLGVAVGVLYGIVIIVTLFSSSIKIIGYLATVMSVLVVVGYFDSAPGGVDWMVIINRLLSLFMIWATAWLICVVKKRGFKLAELREIVKDLNRQNDLILLSVSEGILGLDKNGCLVAVNPAASRMLGWQQSELVGRSFHELMDDADLSRTQCHKAGGDIASCIKNRIASLGNEQRFMRKDGSMFLAEYSATPVEDEDEGAVLAMVVTFQDITVRKKEEDELHNYRSIVAICEDHMSVVDRDYTYLTVNEAYVNAHGQAREKIVGHSIAELLGNEVFESCIKKRMDRCLAGEVVRYSDWFVFPRLGERFMSVIYYPCLGEDGRTVSSVVVTSRDNTSKKRTELELEQSERQFRSVFDSAPLGMALVNESLQPYVSNTVFSEFFGYQRQQLNSMSVLDIIVNDDAQLIAGEFNSFCAGDVDTYSTEKQFVREDGAIIWGALTASSIRDKDGDWICGVVMIDDISERKEAEEMIRYQAYHDALTDLPNRRYFDEILELEWNRGVRAGSALSVLMIDIDNFKSYNDHHGHGAGDDCLARVSMAMSEVLNRPADRIARYGGEEFVVLLPECDLDAARLIAEKLRAGVESLGIAHEMSSSCQCVTVSVGCASLVPTSASTVKELLNDADKRLYQAKESGRNQIC
jgi:diguanylate cyclase (GGDEF)-like protein/PAS domain S-box-containing protein